MFPLSPEFIHEDGEIETYQAGNILLKKGLPQGLPWSPILCTFALGCALKETEQWKLIMYADDGLVLSKEPITKIPGILVNRTMTLLNARLSTKTINGKSVNGPVDQELTFLGIRYDIGSRMIKVYNQ